MAPFLLRKMVVKKKKKIVNENVMVFAFLQQQKKLVNKSCINKQHNYVPIQEKNFLKLPEI